MGSVDRARSRSLSRLVAIKRILVSSDKPEQFGAALVRFQREAMIAAQLRHPNVVMVDGLFRDARGPYLVMEYVEGETLQQRLRQGPLEWRVAVELLLPVCRGLAAAHALRIVHRDIKPANILLPKEGEPKLGDFGIARAEQFTALTLSGGDLGTVAYMAPEQHLDAHSADSRSDLYSLAATLCHMVSGKLPLGALDWNVMPAELRDPLRHALSHNRDDRPASVSEWAKELNARLHSLNAPASPATPDGSRSVSNGACPSCGTNNPTDRKYCRKCNAALFEPCPNATCGKSTPVWDDFCGDCGTDKKTSLQARDQEHKKRADRVERFALEWNLTEAERLLDEFDKLDGWRWEEWRKWSLKRRQDLQDDFQARVVARDESFDAARLAETAGDWAAALGAVAEIPAPLRTREIVDWETGLRQRSERLESLLTQLAPSSDTGRFDDPNCVKLFAQLRDTNPLDPRVVNLLVQWDAWLHAQQRDDAAWQEALRCFDADAFADAITRVQEIPQERRRADQREFVVLCQQRLVSRQRAEEFFVAARALLDRGQVAAARAQLSAVPNDDRTAEYQALLERCDQREAAQKRAERTLDEARLKFDRRNYGVALDLLRRIAEEDRTIAHTKLMSQCEARVAGQQAASRSLDKARIHWNRGETAAARDVLQSIPEIDRTSDIADFLSNCERRLEEEQATTLGRQAAATARTEAEQLFREERYHDALARLAQLDSKWWAGEHVALQRACNAAVAEVEVKHPAALRNAAVGVDESDPGDTRRNGLWPPSIPAASEDTNFSVFGLFGPQKGTREEPLLNIMRWLLIVAAVACLYALYSVFSYLLQSVALSAVEHRVMASLDVGDIDAADVELQAASRYSDLPEWKKLRGMVDYQRQEESTRLAGFENRLKTALANTNPPTGAGETEMAPASVRSPPPTTTSFREDFEFAASLDDARRLADAGDPDMALTRLNAACPLTSAQRAKWNSLQTDLKRRAQTHRDRQFRIKTFDDQLAAISQRLAALRREVSDRYSLRDGLADSAKISQELEPFRACAKAEGIDRTAALNKVASDIEHRKDELHASAERFAARVKEKREQLKRTELLANLERYSNPKSPPGLPLSLRDIKFYLKAILDYQRELPEDSLSRGGSFDDEATLWINEITALDVARSLSAWDKFTDVLPSNEVRDFRDRLPPSPLTPTAFLLRDYFDLQDSARRRENSDAGQISTRNGIAKILQRKDVALPYVVVVDERVFYLRGTDEWDKLQKTGELSFMTEETDKDATVPVEDKEAVQTRELQESPQRLFSQRHLPTFQEATGIDWLGSTENMARELFEAKVWKPDSKSIDPILAYRMLNSLFECAGTGHSLLEKELNDSPHMVVFRSANATANVDWLDPRNEHGSSSRAKVRQVLEQTRGLLDAWTAARRQEASLLDELRVDYRSVGFLERTNGDWRIRSSWGDSRLDNAPFVELAVLLPSRPGIQARWHTIGSAKGRTLELTSDPPPVVLREGRLVFAKIKPDP
jgi:serine/threonine protein kinase